jgi:hypothetical protein
MKNPRWGEEEEDDAAEKGTNEGIMVFYPGQVCIIYKHVLMGLWNGKAQSILLGFYNTNICQEAQVHLVFDLGACVIRRGEIHCKGE